MSITFRLAERGDLPYIVEVYNQTIPTRLATADLEPVTVAARVPWFEAHDPKTRPLWLVELDGVPAGWVSLGDFYGRPAYQGTAEISIYIDQAYRGRRLGQAALTFVEIESERLGIHTILAFIFHHNQASIQLFEKNGYQRWGHLPDIAEMDGIERSLDILGKRV